MEKELVKQHQRDFLEIEKAVECRIEFLRGLRFSEDEIKIRQEELSIVLKILNKIRYYRLNPLESVETVNGMQFKIGDLFHIPGDELSIYKVVLFPDKLTIRGVAKNPAIGKPTVCEVYVEFARKIEAPKAEKVKRIKDKKKSKEVEVGDYFTVDGKGVIYKAIKVTKKKVIGTNEFKSKLTSRIKIPKSDVIFKTKKEYKKQHKNK